MGCWSVVLFALVCFTLQAIGSLETRWNERQRFNTKVLGPKLRSLISRQLSSCHDSPEEDVKEGTEEQVATFAAGCFWSVQLKFDRIPGVLATQVGYTGGRQVHPTYEDIITGETGHAEAVQVHFIPSQVSYEELCEVFFEMHDPTTKNRQGNDVGSNYRSAIFVHSEEQRQIALQVRHAINREIVTLLGISDSTEDKVVTEIQDFVTWWPAEEYHQQYLAKRGQSREKGSLDHVRCYG